MPDQQVMSAEDVAAELRSEPQQVLKLVAAGQLPPPAVKLGRLSRWRRADIEAFLRPARAVETPDNRARRWLIDDRSAELVGRSPAIRQDAAAGKTPPPVQLDDFTFWDFDAVYAGL